MQKCLTFVAVGVATGVRHSVTIEPAERSLSLSIACCRRFYHNLCW